MPLPTLPDELDASALHPVTIYYCKAGIPTGQTVRVMQDKVVTACSGVEFRRVSGRMLHGNAAGKPKSSGARCVLVAESGTITLIP